SPDGKSWVGLTPSERRCRGPTSRAWRGSTRNGTTGCTLTTRSSWAHDASPSAGPHPHVRRTPGAFPVNAFVSAGAGFLLAVLWFDLMFDVQARGGSEVSPAALSSIAYYYARVTTGA